MLGLRLEPALGRLDHFRLRRLPLLGQFLLHTGRAGLRLISYLRLLTRPCVGGCLLFCSWLDGLRLRYCLKVFVVVLGEKGYVTHLKGARLFFRLVALSCVTVYP